MRDEHEEIQDGPPSDRPTLPAWAHAVIQELEGQLERLYSGRACRACKGAGLEPEGGTAGVYYRECPTCSGSGFDVCRR